MPRRLPARVLTLVLLAQLLAPSLSPGALGAAAPTATATIRSVPAPAATPAPSAKPIAARKTPIAAKPAAAAAATPTATVAATATPMMAATATATPGYPATATATPVTRRTATPTAGPRHAGPIALAPSSFPSGLVGYWTGDDTGADSSGNGNNATSSGSYAPGEVNDGFHFDGVSQTASVPDNPSLDPAAVTIAAWIRPDGYTNGTAAPGQDYIVFKQNPRNYEFEGYALALISSGGAEHFSLGIASASGAQSGATSHTMAAVGQWYHVAASYDGSVVRIYVNGVLEQANTAGFPLYYGTAPLYFATSGYAPFDGKLDGMVDEVQIYNRALTDGEVAQVYQTESTQTPVVVIPAIQELLDKAKALSGDPVDTLGGDFGFQHADLAMPGRGPSPAFIRSYNSADPRAGRLGPGWTDSYNIALVTPSNAPGNLVLVGPTGHSDVYTHTNGAYVPPAGVDTTLVENADLTFTATLKDRTTWRFGQTGRLIAIADRFGNVSKLTYNGSGQFIKHKGEFGPITIQQYLAGARRLVAGGSGIQTKIRSNGDTLFYDSSTNEFAILSPRNVIRTYFRPREGVQYWNKQ